MTKLIYELQWIVQSYDDSFVLNNNLCWHIFQVSRNRNLLAYCIIVSSFIYSYRDIFYTMCVSTRLFFSIKLLYRRVYTNNCYRNNKFNVTCIHIFSYIWIWERERVMLQEKHASHVYTRKQIHVKWDACKI